MSIAEGLINQVGRIEGLGRRILAWGPLVPLAAARVTRRGAGRRERTSRPLDLWLEPPRTLCGNDCVSLAERAMERAARVAVTDLGRGLTGLACVASSALSIGVLGTVFGLAAPNLGCGSVGIAAFGAWFAEVLSSVPLGLFVAVCALAAYRSLERERDNLAGELPHALASTLSWMAARTTECCRAPGFSTWKMPAARFPTHHRDNLDSPIRQGTWSFYKLILLWVVMATLLRFLMVIEFDPEPRIPVNLPQTARPVLVERPRDSVIVSIKADGERFVGGKWIPQEQLALALLNAREDSRPSRMLLQADRSMPYREVLEVLRSARDAGFSNVTFITVEGPQS